MTAWVDPREAVRQAVAILGLEGYEPGPFEQVLNERFARGEIDGDQYLELALDHIQGRQAGSADTTAVSAFQDPLAYPGADNRVLINKFDERDYDRLHQLEYAATLRHLAELQLRPISGRFDLDHLQAIHRRVFQDVYAWAGELRQINLAKGGSVFTDGRQLEGEGARVFGALAAEKHLRGLQKAAFVERLAVYYGAINTLHPFREGNGPRHANLFAAARAAGPATRSTTRKSTRRHGTPARRQLTAATSNRCRAVFDAAVSPSRAVAFDRLPSGAGGQAVPGAAFGVRDPRAGGPGRPTGRFLRREDQERFVGEIREWLRQGLHAGEVPRQGPARAPPRRQNRLGRPSTRAAPVSHAKRPLRPVAGG